MADIPPDQDENESIPSEGDTPPLYDDGELPYDMPPDKPKKRPPSRIMRRTYISLPLVIAVCALLVCSAVLLLATSVSGGLALCNLTASCPKAAATRQPTRSHDPVPPRNESRLIRSTINDVQTGTSTTIELTATLVPYSAARCDPQGDYRDHLLFAMESGANAELFLVSSDGSELCRVTDNLIDERSPSWSPDRTRILFSAPRMDDYATDLYTMNMEGGDIVNLTQDQADDYRGVWSPDGKKIVFESNRTGGSQIFVMNADGSQVVNLTPDAINAQEPSWSPSGEQIAYVAGADGDPNKFELYVVSMQSRASRRLTNDQRSQSMPMWSPLGNSLLFYSDNEGGGSDLYTFDLSDDSIHRLTYTSYAVYPSWSPDGTAIAYTAYSAIRSLHILHLDTMQTQPVYTGFAVQSPASWR